MSDESKSTPPPPPPPPDAPKPHDTSASTSSQSAASSRAVWSYKRDGQQVGPFRLEEIRVLADQGLITPATLLIHQNGTQLSAAETTLFSPDPLPPAPPPPPDAKAAPADKEQPSTEVDFGGLKKFVGWLLAIVILGGYRWYKEERQVSTKPSREASQIASNPAPHPPKNKPQEQGRAADKTQTESKSKPDLTYNYDFLVEGKGSSKRPGPRRLKLTWIEATREVLPFLNNLTPQGRAALGIAAVTSGFDIYGARVTLTNIGDRPVEVSPTNLRVHFGNETAQVFVGNDPRFLRPTVLQPSRSVSGLVIFQARADIGAAIRLGDGAMSYEGANVEMIYD